MARTKHKSPEEICFGYSGRTIAVVAERDPRGALSYRFFGVTKKEWKEIGIAKNTTKYTAHAAIKAANKKIFP